MLKNCVILLLLTLILVACNQPTTNEPYDIAMRYLEQQEYKVISHEHSAVPYILTKKKLIEMPYMQIWQKQLINPDDYLGKTIYGESFIIQNHAFDNWESTTAKSLGKTHVHVMIVDGQVIGGTSSPITEQRLVGALWSLDGKTFEELHPNINWRAWADQWIEKYSN